MTNTKTTNKEETRGAPRKGKHARKRKNIMIDIEDDELLCDVGAGNRSEGVHLLAELVRQKPEILKDLEALKNDND